MKHYKKLSAILLTAAIAAAAAVPASAVAVPDLSSFAKLEIPDFTTTDMEGNEVTQDIFSEKDVTMVNIWGTFCSPCISEMPELGEIAEAMPENQQMIGIIIDVAEESDDTFALAQQILEKSGASFTQLLVSEDLTEFLYQVTAVPNTLFVDKDGNILGNTILGASTDEYRERLEEYAQQFPAEASSDAGSESAEASSEAKSENADASTETESENAKA